MKKVLLTLAVIAMAVPAMAADIDFSVTDNGDNSITISYVATTAPRGVALTVDTSGATIGDATLGENGDVLSVDAAFNAYMDYANMMELDTPGSYTVGAGHPLASQTQAGLPTFPASSFSICMGVLDQTGNQGAGPLTSTDLITIQLSGPGTVTIGADTYRSETGAVGSSLTTNLPLVDVPYGQTQETCRDRLTAAEQTDYDAYVAAGKNPDCWCNQYQCHGDFDDATQGFLNFRIFTNDLNGVIANWKAKIDTADPCADIDHASQGFLNFRVFTNDMNIIVANWKAKDAGLADCPAYAAP